MWQRRTYHPPQNIQPYYATNKNILQTKKEKKVINLKGYNFLFGKKAVSPVIGTILMVAVTVIMAAIVGGFVYQTARPKVPPSMSSSLADDSTKGVGTGPSDNTTRVAKLYWEGGKSIDPSEFNLIVTYTDDMNEEQTLTLDGADWLPKNTKKDMGAGQLLVMWLDSDNSTDISPGDRLDFYEVGAAASGSAVRPSTDFNVKVLHKATEAFIADHTIRVY